MLGPIRVAFTSAARVRLQRVVTTPRSNTALFSKMSKSPEDYHRLYMEQMEELQDERTSLFGTDGDVSPKDKAPHFTEPVDPTDRLPTEQEKQARESQFNFTTTETTAWSNCGGSQHQHSPSLLEEIELARRRQREQENATPSAEKVSPELSHITPDGNSVHMVDVGFKEITTRTAIAETLVELPPEVLQAIQKHGHEATTKKGPIFSTAITAGIMAAKQTSQLIPLCHPLPLSHVAIDCTWWDSQTVRIECRCRTTHTTGVEMEAMTGATVAALTVYDMVKAASHHVRIKSTRLIYKDGGKRIVDERT